MSNQVVTFNSQVNTGCSLRISLNNGQAINIGEVTFPYTFDPTQYGVKEINGDYIFDCDGDCQFIKTVEDGIAPTTTTTTEEPTTTTTTTEEPTTTTTTTARTTTTTTTEEPTTTTTTTKALPMFDCENDGLVISVSEGSVGENVTYVATFNGEVLNVISVEPSTYVEGSKEYLFEFRVPEGYSNSEEMIKCPKTLITESKEITTTTTTTILPTFTCDTEGLVVSIRPGVFGDPVTALVSYNLSNIVYRVMPSTYQKGSYDYDVIITVPEGFSNSFEEIECKVNGVTELIDITTTTTTIRIPDGQDAYCRTVTVDTSDSTFPGYGNFAIQRGLPNISPVDNPESQYFVPAGSTDISDFNNDREDNPVKSHNYCSTLSGDQIAIKQPNGQWGPWVRPTGDERYSFIQGYVNSNQLCDNDNTCSVGITPF